MSSTTVPIYYETSWSILSTIGITNLLFGIVVLGITGISPVLIVPLVVSTATAIANGLCYYAFYADYPIKGTAVAAVFADFFWLIQEAGLSFYSYQILYRILPHQERRIFVRIFWFFVFAISSIRAGIMTSRVLDILQESSSRISLIDHLHIGYFLGIASNEVLCSYFLLRMLFKARETSKTIDSNLGLFSYLSKSTEIRLTALAVIGITRTVTFSFQTTAQSATNVAGQVDRFVLTLECVFPIIMYIDILAAKSIVRTGAQSSYSRNRGVQESETATKRGTGVPQGVFPLRKVKTWVDTSERTGSQEYIVEETNNQNRSDNESVSAKGWISKTVEYEVHSSASPV